MLGDVASLFLGIGVFLNAVLQIITLIQASRTAKNMKTLELNTNSKFDQLVQVTKSAAHAEGVIAGHDQAIVQAASIAKNE